MKKILFCLVMLPFLLSCSSDSKDELVNNPIVNTRWESTSSFGTMVIVLEFTSNTSFLEYHIDENGNVISHLGYDEGTYEYKNGEIILIKQDMSNEMNKASVSGNILTLYYKSGSKRLFTKK